MGSMKSNALSHWLKAEKGALPALSVENLVRYMIYIPSLGFLPAALAFHPFEHQPGLKAEKLQISALPTSSLPATDR
jgi:hypothetical protein